MEAWHWITIVIGLWVLKDLIKVAVGIFRLRRHDGGHRIVAEGLRLPFAGEWKLSNTGEGLLAQVVVGNHHAGAVNQRFAFDAVIVQGAILPLTFRREGTANEDFLCFDAPILAAHDGIVATVVDGIRDESPGAMNGYMAFGNVVMIRHTDGWSSVYAHLRSGSITVRVGDQVTAGQEIARCGNSGNSSGPHLHFHVQNGTSFHASPGVRMRFAHVAVKDGKVVESGYVPRTGDRVSHAKPPG